MTSVSSIPSYSVLICLAGALVAGYCSILISPDKHILVVLLGLLLSVFAWALLRCSLVTTAWCHIPLIVGACFALSFFVFDANVQRVIDAQLAPHLEGRDLIANGRVSSAVQQDGVYQRFVFQVDSLIDEIDKDSLGFTDSASFGSTNSDSIASPGNNDERRGEFKGKVRLSWKSEQIIELGDNLSLKVRLKRPRGFVNPKSFDYQHWLLAQNIGATGYIKEIISADSELESAELSISVRLRQLMSGYRLKLLKKLERKLIGLSHFPLIKALLLGDKSEISQQQWTLFQSTGTVHLMAISGLHVGMVSTLAALIFSFFGKPLSLFLKPQVLRVMQLIVCGYAAFVYASLAGFAVPTQRALWCILLFGFMILLGRRTSFAQLLLVIALLLAFANPMILVSPGFVLSFSAVLILVLSFTQRCGRLAKIATFLKAQLVILFALMPFMLALNLPLSVSSPLANCLAIPLIAIFILPLLFLGLALLPVSAYLSLQVFKLANFLLSVLQNFLELIQFSPVYFSDISAAQLVALAFASVLFILPTAFKLRAYAYFVIALVVFIQVVPKRELRTELITLDVGQGLSVLIDDGDKSIVYDIGAKFSETFSIAQRVLLPILQYRGVRDQIEVILSHADNDHAGAADRFLPEVSKLSKQPLVVRSGEAEELNLREVWPCYAGDSVQQVGNAELELLWPLKGQVPLSVESNGNNRSCVLWLRFGDIDVLLLGDIEKSVEYYLLDHAKLPKDIEVLIAPHHGSLTSSTHRLVNWLQPEHVIISAGYNNRYRHPAKAVLKRYDDVGASIWNTAAHGAITMLFDGDRVHVRAERCARPRRWYLDEGYC